MTPRMPGEVRRLLVSHALASVGMSLPWPLLLVLVYERVDGTPHGDLLVGLTGAARMVPYVALSWATGMLADRFRRDRLVRVTLVGRIVLLAGVAVAVAEGWLLAAVSLAAAAIAVSTPAYPALAAAMPDAAGPSRRRATALLVTIEATSFVVGPALGGLLLVPLTRPWVPAVAVVATVAATLLVAGVRLPRPAPVGEGGVPATVGPFAALRTSSATVRAVGVAGLLNFVDMALLIGLLPVAEHVWSGGSSGYGPATGVLGVGALAAPLLWRLGTTAFARARWGLLLLAGAVALLPLTPAVGWALLPLAVAGAATVHVESAVTETIQEAVPDRSRAGVLGLTDSVMVASALVGSLVAPWLVSALGVLGLFGLLTAATLAGLATVGGRPAVVVTGAGVRIPQQRAPADALASARR